jgi:dTDP-4-amino-4,6-dideoxygalactose transaminase
LAAQGIETAIHYPTPLPLLPAYAYLGYTPADFPNAHKASQKMLSLPMYAELTEKEIQTIAEMIRQFYQN